MHRNLTVLAVLVALCMGSGAVNAVSASAYPVHRSHLWHLEHPGGPASGTKWIPLARYVGWPSSACRTLAGVIWHESSGRPWAYNPSGCSGLTQLAPCWWRGKFDPMSPLANLRAALHIWKSQGGSFLPAWAGDPAVVY